MKINNLKYFLCILGCSVSFTGTGNAEDCTTVTLRGMGTLYYQSCPQDYPSYGDLKPFTTPFKVKKDTPINITQKNNGHEYTVYKGIPKPGLNLHCLPGTSCTVVK